MMKHKLPLLLVGTAALYGIIVLCFFPRGFMIDDAYITARYAENLAFHGELTWNVGEDAVEGYTGIALPLVLAGLLRVGISPEAASRAIGILAFMLSAAFLFFIGRRLTLAPILNASVLLLFVTIPILYTHAQSGMETMLFVAALFASIYAALCGRDTTLLFLLLLSSLIRPEGVAFSFFMLLAAGFLRFREGRANGQAFMLRAALIYVAPALVYFLWRWSYYGRLLPNTFYAKSGVGFQGTVLMDIARFLRRYLAVPLLSVAVLCAAETDRLVRSVKDSWRTKRGVVFGIAGLCFAMLLILMLSRSHLLMNFSHRFYTMLLPVAFVLLMLALQYGSAALAGTEKEKPLRYRFILGAVVLLIVYQALFQAVKTRDEFVFARKQVELQRHEHTLIGKTLLELVPADETLAVHSDAGAIPYFSKLRTIDFGGLNDEYLSRAGLPAQDIADYFFAKAPGVAVFTSIDAERVVDTETSDRILADPRFKDYALFRVYRYPSAEVRYHEFVYLRKALYERLKKEGKIP